MNRSLLEKLGFTKSQAKTYIALIKAGHLTPPQLAAKIKEGRTTAYMALAKLEELGLAKQVEKAKTKTYVPTNPSAIASMLTRKRQEVARAEDEYRKALPNMLSYYFTNRPEPGVRFFQGENGLEKIYEDHLRTGQYVQVLRTPADDDYFGPILYRYMDRRAELNIESKLMGAAIPGAVEWAKKNNQRLRRTTTWLPQEAYTAPVEICIYGDKVSYISFGDEAIGMIIESPQIAEAMRQVYALAKKGGQQLAKEAEEKQEKKTGTDKK